MEINVLIFGQLADIIGKSSIKFYEVSDTDALQKSLLQQYPAFEKLTFSIAVNKNIIQQKMNLNNEDEVALLPPFSGG